ncbi:MAG: hypothetical protein V1791_01970 [Pseudomonadota bacterium]
MQRIAAPNGEFDFLTFFQQPVIAGNEIGPLCLGKSHMCGIGNTKPMLNQVFRPLPGANEIALYQVSQVVNDAKQFDALNDIGYRADFTVMDG